MDFALTANQEAIRDAVGKICDRFDDAYWRRRTRGRLPADFHKAFADAGWLGICIPEAYGGSGLGIIEAAIMMRTIAESGAGMSGRVRRSHQCFRPQSRRRVRHRRAEAAHAAADDRGDGRRLALPSPSRTPGLNTTQLKTRAVRKGDRYVVNGQKVWISTAQVADKILLLARTTPLEEVKRPTDGLSLFYTDFDRSRIKVHEIEKMGRKAVDSNELFIEDFEIPIEDRIGEEGRGLRIHSARHESRSAF